MYKQIRNMKIRNMKIRNMKIRNMNINKEDPPMVGSDAAKNLKFYPLQ